jgi:hypothetical protein
MIFSELAAKDGLWRSLLPHPFIFSRIYNMPMPIYNAWNYLSDNIDQTKDEYSSLPFVFLNPDRLLHLRKLILHQPLAPVPQLIRVGEVLREADRHRAELHAKKVERQKAGKGKEANPIVSDDSPAKLRNAQERLKEIYNEGEHLEHSASSLLGMSPLAGVRIGNSTSSKLNYILNEVRMLLILKPVS